MDLVQDVGFFGRGKEVWNIVAKGGERGDQGGGE